MLITFLQAYLFAIITYIPKPKMSSVRMKVPILNHSQQRVKNENQHTDDPDKLLNEWLGELDNLIGVSFGMLFLSKTFFFVKITRTKYWHNILVFVGKRTFCT